MKILDRIKGITSNLDKFKVECSCGRIFTPYVNNYNSGKVKSCGKGICHAHFNDITGKTFGYLKVIELIPETLMWKTQCVCGKFKNFYSSILTTKHTKSCGCMSGKMWSDKSYKGVEALWNQLYNSYKTGAKNRNYSFEVSFDQFKDLCSKECNYCGRVGVTNRIRNSTYKTCSLKYNGLDRYDNSRGYELSNIVTCCETCNYAKGEQTFEQFENWLKVLINNNLKTKTFNI